MKLENVDLKTFKKVAKEFASKHTVCQKCLGVGCLPKNFGVGNPDAKPCYVCRGKGFIKL